MPELSSEAVYRPTSKVILYRGDRIITVTGKSGIMNFSGGGIDLTDKDPEFAARREMREELGIEASHIGNLEFNGVIDGITGKIGSAPILSQWHVHTADLLIPVSELVPNPEEIVSFGGYRRSEVLANPTLSKLAYRALVNFT